MPASEEIRRDNALWVKRRAKWRKEYNALAREIAIYKGMVQIADSLPVSVTEAEPIVTAANIRVGLRALQDKARKMMVDRLVISGMLHATAYKWEDVG